MSEPTGKLKFAYETIATLEQQLKERDALLDECESCFKFFSTVASSSTQKEMAENMQTKIKNRDKP